MSDGLDKEVARFAQLADVSLERAGEQIRHPALLGPRRQVAGRVRRTYAFALALFLVVICEGLLSATGVVALPRLIGTGLLFAACICAFSAMRELPLLTELWARWITPVFVLGAGGLLIAVPGDATLYGPALAGLKTLFFAIAAVAAFSGMRFPITAQVQRARATNPMRWDELSADEQMRVFPLAPWMSPYRWGKG
ncbi:hypothetical protein [Aliiroseovarius sp.]|uniref:hypothetical protein n=1 Tax=Aliiroseovarius sp. TaxID=1872442 RepID=UPI003BAD2C75